MANYYWYLFDESEILIFSMILNIDVKQQNLCCCLNIRSNYGMALNRTIYDMIQAAGHTNQWANHFCAWIAPRITWITRITTWRRIARFLQGPPHLAEAAHFAVKIADNEGRSRQIMTHCNCITPLMAAAELSWSERRGDLIPNPKLNSSVLNSFLL